MAKAQRQPLAGLQLIAILPEQPQVDFRCSTPISQSLELTRLGSFAVCRFGCCRAQRNSGDGEEKPCRSRNSEPKIHLTRSSRTAKTTLRSYPPDAPGVKLHRQSLL